MKTDTWSELFQPFDEIEPSATELITPLNQYGLISVSGDDAAAFLQAQLTRDVLHMTLDRSCLAAWCNAKGRVLTIFRVIPLGDRFLLRLPSELIERILLRLKMFVLRSKVSLEDVSGQWVHAGLLGAKTTKILADNFHDLPTANGGLLHTDNTILIRAPGDEPRFELIATEARFEPIAQALAPHSSLADYPVWQLGDIRAGIPEVWTQTYEQFIPQNLNLDLLDAVSLRKGCYPGQEIVARTHYLGKVKRRMYLAHTTDTLPSPGDKLYSDASEQSAGLVVSAARGQEHTWLLAVLNTAPCDAPLHLALTDNPPVTPVILPYALASDPAS